MEHADKKSFLEALFKKYADVPMEVVVKCELIRNGFCFTRAALDLDPRHKDYQLFSWDKSSVEDMEDQQAPVKLPDCIELKGGPYNLRRIRMRPIIDMQSPYLVDLVDGVNVVMDKVTREPIVDLLPFTKEPEYGALKFEDGTLYRNIIALDGDCIIFRQCQYWGPKNECKYCDINANAVKKMKLGQVPDIKVKSVEKVAEAARALFSDETFDPYHRPHHIHLNGGSITGELKGLKEFDFYVRYAEAIVEKVGNRWPIILQTSPFEKELEKEIRKIGNITRMSNYEVWDKDLFEIICPGKAKNISRDDWIRMVVDQVDVYGEGNVCPGFVAGVEMAGPWGFKTVEEAVKSTTEGMDFFMSRGVVVRPLHWVVEALSALGGQEPPPVDYYIQIDRNWFELWSKYNLPPVVGLMQVGPGLNWFHATGAFDMAVMA